MDGLKTVLGCIKASKHVTTFGPFPEKEKKPRHPRVTSQISQLNTCWNNYLLENSSRDLSDLHASFEIYIPLHLSDLNNSANVRHEFHKEKKIGDFFKMFKRHRHIFPIFMPISAGTSPYSFGISQIIQKMLPLRQYRKAEENPWIFRTSL